MNKKTLNALDGSIEQWRKIIEEGGEDGGDSNCPLCGLFFINTYCEGCPVAKASDNYGCMDTPYEAWSKHLDTYHDGGEDKVQCPECETLARAELKFLEGLRP